MLVGHETLDSGRDGAAAQLYLSTYDKITLEMPLTSIKHS